MNLTIELLRVLGSPFVSVATVSRSRGRLIDLSQASAKNRMLYQKERLKYLKTQEAIARTSQILKDANIKHVLIKTIRPYISTTVDIDVLIFGSNFEYEEAIMTFLKSGYRMLGQGPQSTTLQDPIIDIKIDIYNEIAVSQIVYLDKRKLANLCNDTRLPNGESARTLTPEADLATVIPHSIVKEHMYTLAE